MPGKLNYRGAVITKRGTDLRSVMLASEANRGLASLGHLPLVIVTVCYRPAAAVYSINSR
mgnify:CR=1 FL=1